LDGAQEEDEEENKPALGAEVVAREKACRRGAETAEGARRASSAASVGVSAPSWSGSWKQSSSVVVVDGRAALVLTLAVDVVVELGWLGTGGRCWFAEGVRR